MTLLIQSITALAWAIAAGSAAIPIEASAQLETRIGQETVAARPGASRKVPRSSELIEAKTAGNPQQVSLALGEILMLPMRGKVRRVAVGNGANVSATTVDTSLMLIGEQVGVTTLLVWTDRTQYSYRVKVVASDFSANRRLIERVLNDTPGITIEEYDSKLVVSGIANRKLFEQLSSLVKDQPNVLLNLRLEEDSPQVRTVLFRLHFVEVAKTLIETIGVQWATDAAGPTFAAQGAPLKEGIYRGLTPAKPGDNLLANPPPFVSNNGKNSGFFFGLATVIASRINLGVTDGDARVLASPELTAKSGGNARLQVGGEVPIPMAGAFGTQTVEFKPYGIIFSIEPVIDSTGTISARISTELSQIDPSVTVAGIPGFITRSTSTDINVRPGQMIALSGLLNNELSNAIDRVPGLGNIPILGRLFRSDAYRHKKTDLVVLLEPEIISTEGIAEEVRQRGVNNMDDFKKREKADSRDPLPLVIQPTPAER